MKFLSTLAALAFAGSVNLAAAQEQTWSPPKTVDHEVVVGSKEAVVTVVEYASLTCPHCARFHNEAWDSFKEAWVDTGKARFVYRHLPLDMSALAGSLVVSCVPEDAKQELVGRLFQTVGEWAPKMELVPVLKDVLGADADIDGVLACMAEEGLPEQVVEAGNEAIGNGVRQTPTFFINGTKVEGFTSAKAFNAAVAQAYEDASASTDVRN